MLTPAPPEFVPRSSSSLQTDRLPGIPDGAKGRLANLDLAILPGLRALWRETVGDAQVRIAVLDGPVDLSHPCFHGANLEVVNGLVPGGTDLGPAGQHGTHVASIIFGQPGGPIQGMAPRCRGLLIPIFRSGASDLYRVCTQLDLARAIALAMERGAHIINVSAGEFAPLGEASPFLEKVVQDCVRQGVLIVAAAGNQGCECLHVPAALTSVLAVGAMNGRGEPFAWSNWGNLYQVQGILAPGEHIAGAGAGGGVYRATGTSPATALVTGVVGLLVSLQIKRGQKPDPLLVREALLLSAGGCPDSLPTDCRRFLAGRLNVEGAISFINQGKSAMSEPGIELQANGASPHVPPSDTAISPGLPAPNSPTVARAPEPSGVQTSACAACQQAAARPGLVYTLGQIGYDFTSEARLDSFAQKLAAVAGAVGPPRHLAFEPPRMLAYLAAHPWDAASLEWTLSLDGHAIYAIRPQGPFAAEIYQQLRDFLQDRVNGVERFSIPGILAGQAPLLLGQTVPVIVPDPRAMYSWNTNALVQAVVGAPPPARAAAQAREQHARRMDALQNFLERVYHELRNLGVASQERAINYAATNGFEAGRIFESALQQNMELDSINVIRSPVGRQGSDSWDVELYFFYPERQVQTVRRVFRYTVDVSDIVPVTVGPVRSWFTR